ncbi:MAG TPA: tripartite tricarboxylate transporter substrate binding protein [Thermosynergistes sp.]|nr:tripartite tricarboxylate transporter substrate binding protein [Thermosynergistes sp.]
MASIGLIAMFALLMSSGGAHAAYPERPVQIICPWGAGGGTDQVARTIGAILQEDLGVPFNVVNRTGGSGAIGHMAGAKAQPDGYTLTIITIELNMMHWMGMAEVTYKDFRPIGMVNYDPAAIWVAADSKWNKMEDLVNEIKANPGKLRASGTGTGGIWHLSMAGWLSSMGLPPNAVTWVPSTGAAEGLRELVGGGVDFAPCSLPEGMSLYSAGKIRGLAVMADERIKAFPEIPTLKELGVDWSLGCWRGIAGPKGLPDDVVDILEPALKKAVESERFVNFMDQVGYGIIWIPSAEAAEFLEKDDEVMGNLMKELGLAK